MYPRLLWLDEVSEFPDRFRETVNPDGSVTHEEAFGEIETLGTLQSGPNFTRMEDGIFDAHLAFALFLQGWRQSEDGSPEIRTVTLTNNQKWPFNNSEQTISLTILRPTTNYTIEAAVMSATGGQVHGVKITDRLANGFKIAFDGDATSAVIKLIIKGGVRQ